MSTLPAVPVPGPLGTKAPWGEQFLSAIVARTASWPIYAYGASYAVLVAGWCTVGNHYLQQAAAELKGGAITSYAVGAQRIPHVLGSLINETSLSGIAAPVAGAKWPGVSARNGLVVLDSIGNDIGHYPSHSVSPVVPAQITLANTKYLDGIKGMYRAAFALISSESRVEQSAATFTGTWTNTAFSAGSASGGTFAYTTTVGAAADFSVTPAQSGPLAGKVFVLLNKFSTELVAAGMATINVQVDGGTATPVTVTPWERYVGLSSINIDSVWDCVPVTVPIDGAAHSVKLTHAGSAGQRMDIDCVLIPSVDPNPIAVMGCDTPPVTHAGVFDAAGVKAWTFNIPLVQNAIKTIMTEFPNTIWVPSTMSTNGLSSFDGLHPNDRGMAQRSGDLCGALKTLIPKLRSRALSIEPDSSFAVI